MTKEEVRKVVHDCRECQSIDPAPSVHTPGELGVSETWERLAIDTTHYRGLPYLTMVDCGPGRFVIWKELRGETAREICDILEIIFCERGPVREILMDNAQAFRSGEMEALLKKWEVQPIYRAAYRASGNGIVERNHRTIKAIAERTGKSPIEAVFWHNVAPREGQKVESVPQKSVATYEWRVPGGGNKQPTPEFEGQFQVGDKVWVKPGVGRCTTRWVRGTVTGENSRNNVEINGVPRHVLDIRRVGDEADDIVIGGEDGSDNEDNAEEIRRHPRHERRAPLWMHDFVAQ